MDVGASSNDFVKDGNRKSLMSKPTLSGHILAAHPIASYIVATTEAEGGERHGELPHPTMLILKLWLTGRVEIGLVGSESLPLPSSTVRGGGRGTTFRGKNNSSACMGRFVEVYIDNIKECDNYS